MIDGVPCSLKPLAWKVYLEGDHDKDYISDSVSNGFKIVDAPDSQILRYEVSNYSSAEDHAAKSKLDVLLQQELKEGKISHVTYKPKCVHAYGAVPKKNSEDLRPITDCSRPYGNSINNYINYEK